MARKVRPEDLSESELRRLLIEKKRVARTKRLEDFRRSGRLLDLSPIPDTTSSNLLMDLDQTEYSEPSKEDQQKTQRKKLTVVGC